MNGGAFTCQWSVYVKWDSAIQQEDELSSYHHKSNGISERKREIVYGLNCPAIVFGGNGSWVYVLCVLSDPDECHDGTLKKIREIQVQSLYRGQIWNWCKSCQNMYQYIPRLTWIQKIYIFTYFQYVSAFQSQYVSRVSILSLQGSNIKHASDFNMLNETKFILGISRI